MRIILAIIAFIVTLYKRLEDAIVDFIVNIIKRFIKVPAYFTTQPKHKLNPGHVADQWADNPELAAHIRRIANL